MKPDPVPKFDYVVRSWAQGSKVSLECFLPPDMLLPDIRLIILGYLPLKFAKLTAAVKPPVSFDAMPPLVQCGLRREAFWKNRLADGTALHATCCIRDEKEIGEEQERLWCVVKRSALCEPVVTHLESHDREKPHSADREIARVPQLFDKFHCDEENNAAVSRDGTRVFTCHVDGEDECSVVDCQRLDGSLVWRAIIEGRVYDPIWMQRFADSDDLLVCWCDQQQASAMVVAVRVRVSGAEYAVERLKPSPIFSFFPFPDVIHLSASAAIFCLACFERGADAPVRWFTIIAYLFESAMWIKLHDFTEKGRTRKGDGVAYVDCDSDGNFNVYLTANNPREFSRLALVPSNLTL